MVGRCRKLPIPYFTLFMCHVSCRHNVCHLVVAFTICFFSSLFSFNHMPQVNIGYKTWTKWCSRWTNNLAKLPKLAVWLVIQICCLSLTAMKFGRYSKRRKRYRTGAVQIIYDRIARVHLIWFALTEFPLISFRLIRPSMPSLHHYKAHLRRDFFGDDAGLIGVYVLLAEEAPSFPRF